MAERKNLKKVRTGVVVSNKMAKTVVVLVERKVKHPLYQKYFVSTKKYMVHDEECSGKVGDLVRIMETRKISKNKSWRLLEIVEQKK